MDIREYKRVLTGISGVHVTAYSKDGEIEPGLTGKIIRRIADAGVHNVVSGGNTGEFYSLRFEEVLRLQAICIAAADGKAAVTAAAGRSEREAIATAAAAKREGADGIMVHHPLDPFAAPHCQADYFIAIAEASELPLVAYIRSDAIPVADLVRVATHPNIAGVKFASSNLMLLSECVRATEGTDAVWICGLAEGWAAPFYALGARGFTSGLVNVDPLRSLAVWKALEAGDYAAARRLVAEIAGFETLRTKFNNGANVTVVKEALMLRGEDVGPVRRPGLPALDAVDRSKLEQMLKSWEPIAA
ncbi:dihydrodipicolinate synthase family protein [Rhizobium sp. LC145]|uniref:dihydrodipicolinate synthase family protein n=1 Tax=Rhizobium sp. LC145 TaxID=1120688 RepID=UPI00062A21C6|nr:dihydrodipicolinate synthase family protein [Rhizobium sp. LC145]KKX30727.1 dihydrodipicolinate synthase [Rhizobium sp. LC145]TKT68434.1 dihydrodipicolinate synthase family protein [Rhizobiaceae bacterium LC148]